MRLSTWLSPSSFRYGPAGSFAARATSTAPNPPTVAHAQSSANRPRPRGFCAGVSSGGGGMRCIDVLPLQCNGETLGTASNWRTRLRAYTRPRPRPARPAKPQLRVQRRLALPQLEIEVCALERAAIAHGANHVCAAHLVSPCACECAEVCHQGEISVAMVDDDQVPVSVEPAGVHDPARVDGAHLGPFLAAHVDPALQGHRAVALVHRPPEARLDAPRLDREQQLAAHPPHRRLVWRSARGAAGARRGRPGAAHRRGGGAAAGRGWTGPRGGSGGTLRAPGDSG